MRVKSTLTVAETLPKTFLLGVETRGAMVRVDVRDNGPGIAGEDREVIFEKFRQGGDTRINRPAGTGLGLPISRQIVEHLGGRLWVESHAGEGATFSFTVPVAVVGAGSSAGAEAREGETWCSSSTMSLTSLSRCSS